MKCSSKKHLLKKYDIQETFPLLFSKTCSNCCEDFKYEKMWDIVLYGNRWGNVFYEDTLNNHKYFCKNCFDKQDVIDLCDEMIK